MVRRLIVALIVLAAVAGVSGGPASADVAWSPATEISPRGTAFSRAEVAVDAAGNAVAAFMGGTADARLVRVAEKPAGGSWGAPVTISDPRENPFELALAVNARGDAVVVWVIDDGFVRASSRPAGGGWGPPVSVVEGAFGRDVGHATVGIDAAGNALAVWAQRDPDRLIRSSRLPKGGTWGAPVVASPPEPNHEYSSPSVGVDAGGAATLAWVVDDDVDTNVEVAELAPGAQAWSSPRELTEPGSGRPFSLTVVASSVGITAVLWQARIGELARVQAAVRTPGGFVWPAGSPISEAGSRISDLSASFAGNGSLSAIWARGTDAASTVESARWSANTFAWGPAVALTGAGSFGQPVIAADDQDGAVAVWDESRPDGVRISTASRTPAGTWGPAVPLGDGGPAGADPRLALTPAGTGTAVWIRRDGLLASVMGSSLAAVAPPAGGGAPGGGSPGGGAGAPAGQAGPGGKPTVGGQGGALPVAGKAPIVSEVKMTNTKFRVAPGRTALSAATRVPRGTAFVFSLTAPARVQIAITRTVTGARSKGRCVKRTGKLRKARARTCRRAILVGTLTRVNLAAGRRSVTFTGRLGRKALGARTYKATIIARNSAGRSKAKTLTFTVVK